MIVTIECDSPNVVLNGSIKPIKVEVSLTKDGVDGYSAYELAVKYGYTGSEEEFAKSLILGDTNRDWAQDFLIAFNL